MSTFLKSILILGFLFGSFLTHAQNLVVKHVNPVNNPLVDSLVGQLVGQGLIVQNVRSNLKETSKAIGTFKAPEQLLGGIRGGLMMTTGQADTMAGSNSGGGIISVQIPPTDTLAGCSEGRQMLNSILKFGSSPTNVRRTTNCATIQFDIIPSSDSIKFNYVFASEEYNTFVCSNFNDIFGFFITGPGITGDQSLAPDFPNSTNIAIIPGTNLPVSINTVNNGTPGTSGTAANCEFTLEGTENYIDNTPAQNDPFIHSRLRFNGLTKVLTAGVKVTPCEVYTLTLTVSDVQDGSYDSGVFIEKGSLRSSIRASVTTQYNDRFPYAIVNCNPGKIEFKRCYTVDRAIIRYTIEGTAQNSIDYKERLENGTLVDLIDSLVMAPGQERDSIVILGLDNPTWDSTSQKKIVLRFLNYSRPFVNGQPNFNGDTAVMLIRRKFIFNAGQDKEICQFVDTNITPITANYPGDRFLWRELNASGDTIVSPDLSCDSCRITKAMNDSTKTFVVFVTDSASQCIASDTIRVKVQAIPTISFSSEPPGFAVCKEKGIDISANPFTADTAWRYEWFNILPENSQNISNEDRKKVILQVVKFRTNQYFPVRVESPLGCMREDSVLVRVLTKPDFALKQADTVCYGTPYRITPIAQNDSVGDIIWNWRSSTDRRLIDSTRSSVSFRAIKSERYVLEGNNSCFGSDGVAKDTFNLFVFDSISTAFTYEILNDGLTSSPVKFTQSFIPFSYPRSWKLWNEEQSFYQELDGNSPTVEITKGGNYTVEAIIYKQEGSYFCSDTTYQKFAIEPLGQVFIPTLITDNLDNLNSVFLITARDENGKLLRNITDGTLTVFNRWGKEIFKTDVYENDLNNAKLKEKLVDGVYFFEFKSPRYNYANGGWFRVQR